MKKGSACATSGQGCPGAGAKHCVMLGPGGGLGGGSGTQPDPGMHATAAPPAPVLLDDDGVPLDVPPPVPPGAPSMTTLPPHAAAAGSDRAERMRRRRWA